MAQHETDYLIVGAGAAGLAFADTLVQETDAHVTIVDRHAKPGGHWNDAYPFVALHQPSAFYGVNSLPLGTLRKDTVGPNAGYYELASGTEVCGYFHNVMYQQLLPSGRVSYYPMSRYLATDDGAHRFVSNLSGTETQVKVRKKIVDANYFGPTVPATHTPKFSVAAGVLLVTPTGLLNFGSAAINAPRVSAFWVPEKRRWMLASGC
jgi:NAD(P)-binding Rossmann-like domain